MAIFGKKIKEEKEADKPPVKSVKKNTPAKIETKTVHQASAGKTSDIRGAVIAHHLTEKSSAASRENKFIFLIAKIADKKTVKREIEARFGVQAEKINIINLPGKERRRGSQIGWKPGSRKAVVTLKEGQTIEVR